MEVFSAGTEPSQVHSLAITAMAEMGIDISRQRSKHLSEFLGQSFDHVITLCESARQACPFFPGQYQTHHWDLEDPARAEGSDEQRIEAFRRVRDELGNRIHGFISSPDRSEVGDIS